MESKIEELSRTVEKLKKRIYASDHDIEQFDDVALTIACSLDLLETESELSDLHKKEYKYYLRLYIDLIQESSRHMDLVKPKIFDEFYKRIDDVIDYFIFYPEYHVAVLGNDAIIEMKKIFNESNHILISIKDAISENESFCVAIDQLKKKKIDYWFALGQMNSIPFTFEDKNNFFYNRNAMFKYTFDENIKLFDYWNRHEKTQSYLLTKLLSNKRIQGNINH